MAVRKTRAASHQIFIRKFEGRARRGAGEIKLFSVRTKVMRRTGVLGGV